MKIRSGSSFSQVVLVNGNTVRSVEFPITVYCVLVLVSSTKWKNATNKMIGSTMSLGYRRAPGIPPREIWRQSRVIYEEWLDLLGLCSICCTSGFEKPPPWAEGMLVTVDVEESNEHHDELIFTWNHRIQVNRLLYQIIYWISSFRKSTKHTAQKYSHCTGRFELRSGLDVMWLLFAGPSSFEKHPPWYARWWRCAISLSPSFIALVWRFCILQINKSW